MHVNKLVHKYNLASYLDVKYIAEIYVCNAAFTI